MCSCSVFLCIVFYFPTSTRFMRVAVGDWAPRIIDSSCGVLSAALYIMMEHAAKGDLHSALAANGSLSLPPARFITAEIILGASGRQHSPSSVLFANVAFVCLRLPVFRSVIRMLRLLASQPWKERLLMGLSISLKVPRAQLSVPVSEDPHTCCGAVLRSRDVLHVCLEHLLIAQAFKHCTARGWSMATVSVCAHPVCTPCVHTLCAHSCTCFSR